MWSDDRRLMNVLEYRRALAVWSAGISGAATAARPGRGSWASPAGHGRRPMPGRYRVDVPGQREIQVRDPVPGIVRGDPGPDALPPDVDVRVMPYLARRSISSSVSGSAKAIRRLPPSPGCQAMLAMISPSSLRAAAHGQPRAWPRSATSSRRSRGSGPHRPAASAAF